MGNCVSTPGKKDKKRSDAIDRQIEDDSKRFKRECKILLLGEQPWYPRKSFLMVLEAPVDLVNQQS
jgi:hypothetical protein